jgi:hypothetical protein
LSGTGYEVYIYVSASNSDIMIMQLMKQTTNNPRMESQIRGWILIATMATKILPSQNLYFYVLRYLKKNCIRNDECGVLALFSIKSFTDRSLPLTKEFLLNLKNNLSAVNVFSGSLDTILNLEHTNALLYSQGLLIDNEPSYGCDIDGIKKGGHYMKEQSVGCAVLTHRDRLVQGAMVQYKKTDEKSYSNKFISASPDLMSIEIGKDSEDKKKRVVSVFDLVGVVSCAPQVRQIFVPSIFE